jgi:hypothetical protein
MGRKEFSRTITETTIKAVELSFKDGKAVTTPVADLVIRGKVADEDKAMSLVKKAYDKKKQYGIVSMTNVDTLYELSVEDFLKYAHKVDPVSDNKSVNADKAGNK